MLIEIRENKSFAMNICTNYGFTSIIVSGVENRSVLFVFKISDYVCVVFFYLI